jgi:hypothetical protein
MAIFAKAADSKTRIYGGGKINKNSFSRRDVMVSSFSLARQNHKDSLPVFQ